MKRSIQQRQASFKETATDHPDFSKVDTLIRSKVAAGVPSIAIAVSQHGKIIWTEAVGKANLEDQLPATVDTPYYLASVSKTITATSLMELVDRGEVRLDRPVNDYLGSAKLSSLFWSPSDATVERMATHTAGLTTYDRNCPAIGSNCSIDTNDLIRRYGVIVWQPGDHFDYSNADYGILGEVVAHTSKESLAAFLQRNVFNPLDMKRCFLDSNTQQMSTAAARYDSSNTRKQVAGQRSTTPGASSMYCSVHDLVLFGMFQLKDHLATQKQILPDRMIDTMQRSFVSVDNDSEYGLGWWIEKDLHGYRGVLAQGGTNDATAYLQLVPTEDIAIAMLWNTGTPDGAKVIDEVLSTLLPPYRLTLVNHGAQPLSNPVANNLNAQLEGRWTGAIQTYKGQLPLAIAIRPSGEGSVRLGSAPEIKGVHFQFGKGMVKWRMRGPSGLGDTGPGAYSLDIKLYLHGNTLVGAARTQSSPPSTDTTLLFYGAKLRKN